jgi:hypothetical protein
MYNNTPSYSNTSVVEAKAAVERLTFFHYYVTAFPSDGCYVFFKSPQKSAKKLAFWAQNPGFTSSPAFMNLLIRCTDT